MQRSSRSIPTGPPTEPPRCPVLLGTRDSWRPCDLPAGQDRDGRAVCRFHARYSHRLRYVEEPPK